MTDSSTIPVPVFRPIVDRWLAMFETPEDGYQALSANSDLTAAAWRKRLTDQVYANGTPGWWAVDEISASDVDELLAAMDATEIWHTELADWSAARLLRCEDCGKAIEPGDYRQRDRDRCRRGHLYAVHGRVRGDGRRYCAQCDRENRHRVGAAA